MEDNKFIKKIGNLYLNEYLGCGGNTQGVFKGTIMAKNKNTKENEYLSCVAKSFTKKQMRDKGFKIRYEREKEIGLWLNHQNIVKAFGEVKSKTMVYLVMEYLNGGDLKEFIEDKKSPSNNEKILSLIIYQIMQGLNHLHENNIMNRDIKLENVLLHFYDQEIYYKMVDGKKKIAYELQDYSKCIVKLCDLGFSKQLELNDDEDPNQQSSQHTILFTTAYKPKEADSGIYNKTFDYWCLGILIKNLLSGFIDEDTEHCTNFKFDKNLVFSIEIREIMDGLLKDNPEERKSCKLLLNHNFFTQNSKTLIDYRNLKDINEEDKIDQLFELNTKKFTDFNNLFNQLNKKN